MYARIAMIWPSLNTEPNAGMEPILPFLMRSMMNSSLRSVFDSFGPLPAARPPSVLTGKGGKEKSLPPTPSSLSFQREDNKGAGILRHALEGLAIERDVLVGHQAAPAGRYGDVLLETCNVADDAGIMAHAVVVRPELLAAIRIVGVHDTFGIRHEHQIARGGEDAGERRLFVVDLPLQDAGDGIAGVEMTTGGPVRRRHQLEVGADVELGHRLKDRRGLQHRKLHAP